MQIVVPELEIDIGNEGFEQDKLGLAPLGTRLSELVEKADGPFVVAIDGRWGSGKSTFLKMWTGAHMLADETEANVLYFDAFQHDFLDDPMTSLVALLAANVEPLSLPRKAVRKLRKATAAIAVPATRLALAYATSSITKLTSITADAAINKAGKIADSEASAFWKKEEGRIAAIRNFKLGLTELSAEKKLVVEQPHLSGPN